LESYQEAEKYLEEKRKNLMEEWGIDPVPDEPTPEGKGRGAERAFSVRNYGLNTWGDLFNSRQKLALITFVEKVRLAHKKMLKEGYDKEYAKAVVSYLAFVVSRIPETNSTICHWDSSWEKTSTTFARQALPMNWDFIEANVFTSKGYSFENILKTILNVFPTITIFDSIDSTIRQYSATSLPYPDNYFDAVFTSIVAIEETQTKFISGFG
ncbi:MAG: DNA methylase, partial [archaeon]|nr:DNA methylase [archaeon]